MVEPTVRHVDGLEVATWEAADGVERAPLVLLHEGLGSVGLWRSFPSRLSAATGRRVVAYSRPGHGRSRPLPRPHGPDYMHLLAAQLGPFLRDGLGVAQPVLVGHSDGASIALLHAASSAAPQPAGLVLIAPHVVVEQRSVDGIRAARERYATTDLPRRMARHHDDAASLFRAWNDVWLSPRFRSWDITAGLSAITAPTLLVQAADDEYGTLRQLELIASRVAGPCERFVPDDGGHAPHLAHPDTVTSAVAAFLDPLD